MHRYNKQGKESIDVYDIVKIVKASRIKPFRGHKKAHPGMIGIVVSNFTNSYGTSKLTILNELGIEHTHTENAVQFLGSLNEEKYKEVWTQSLRKWMDRTYVPVFVFHKFNHQGMPRVKSRKGDAFLVITMQNNEFWISQNHIHIDDVPHFREISIDADNGARSGKSEIKSIRIPVWIAEKNKLFGP